MMQKLIIIIFTFDCEYDENLYFKSDFDVDDADDFISRLKDYNQDYEQNPDLDPSVFLTRTDFFNQEYNDHENVIDEDFDEEYLVLVNLEDCTVEFYEQNFLTELKQARADREKQQGQEFSLEQKQSKGRCRQYENQGRARSNQQGLYISS